MSLPTWAPDVGQVGVYIPGRTLSIPLGEHLGTFDPTTRPTDDWVAQIIDDACGWVTLKTGTIHSSLEGAARSCAAIRAAAAVELGWPDRNADVDTAQQLHEQAARLRDDLHEANLALTGADPTDPSGAVPVLYGFPAAPAWGDLNI